MNMCCRCAKQLHGCLLDIHSTDFCIEVRPKDIEAAKTIQLDLAAQMRVSRNEKASYLRYLVLARLIEEMSHDVSEYSKAQAMRLSRKSRRRSSKA